jgi:hypothetical protein
VWFILPTDFSGDKMKRTLIFALSCAMASCVFAQDDGSKPKAQKGSARSVFPNEIQELKDAVAAQQEQIKQLQQQISTRDQAIQQLQSEISNLPKPPAPPTPPDYSGDISTLQGEVKDLKANDASIVDTLTETQKRIGELETPLAIHYKGITLTPGGFMAGETVWRQRAEGADINTNLNGIPFGGANQAYMSEFYGSGRQSRISMLMQGKLSNINLAGYYEMDFLSAGVTSNNNQSNSYTLRQRQAFAQAALNNGWTFTAGQMWSLVTETRKGLENRTEATPLQIDAQYTVGFSWARQYGFRVTKNYHNKMWFGFSVENAQETLTTHGNTANSYLIGSQGNGGGLYNAAITGCSTTLNASGAPVTTCSNAANYSWNPSPDFIAKAAFEPGFGHYEIFGILTQFRDRIFPNAGATVPTAAGAYNKSTWTGGGGANARWMFAQKKVEVALHGLGGRGVGRYGDSTLSDITINPFGAIVPITAYQALLTLEYHIPKWDFYGYGGTEYDGRTAFLNAKGAPVGYGSRLFNNTGCGIEVLPSPALTAGFSPGSLANCNGDTKDIWEGTMGFWWKPYNGPKGRLQLGAQYSYVTKQAWTGFGTGKPPAAVGANPTATENMIFTSFRYYLP